uniref:NADH-ubiquinone oxidoreductase chain 2 n=1 Tax=Stolephorus waitei TaxID=686574 RepID=A0A4Y5RSU6_9TELE|nr:NADH dehydrogenase subunit 2 [Stolephorus waitei]QCZ36024.1 NADH dehydrogenase subunit 2 [Stolephorus waitei]
MNPFVLSVFLISLGLGTTLTFMSSHWLLAWMGLEINTLAIIPLMAQKHHPRAVEATTKYFLIQATAAAMILFAATSNAWMFGVWDINQTHHPVISAIVMTALALKVGLAPLHLWLPEVLQGVTLMTGLILSTWQKLAPLALIMQASNNAHPALLTSLALCSTLVGGWGGLNQTQIRKILAYSSIAHLGWMILVSQMAPKIALIALMTYITMTSAAFLGLININSTKTITLASTWTKAPTLAALMCLVLLSLGGLPPLTGFMPKWLIIQELATQKLASIATVIALTALLSLYFYLRLTYAITLTLSPQTSSATTPWRIQAKKLTLALSFTIILALCLLPITPTIFILLT